MPTILLIEDNGLNRDMLSRRLAKRNFQIAMAVDGEEGHTLAHQTQPDLIIMDMSLPIIDGWKLSGLLKKHPDTQHIPILALTAHAMVGDREKALAAGCDEYETKPIEFSKLLSKIDLLLANGVT